MYDRTLETLKKLKSWKPIVIALVAGRRFSLKELSRIEGGTNGRVVYGVLWLMGLLTRHLRGDFRPTPRLEDFATWLVRQGHLREGDAVSFFIGFAAEVESHRFKRERVIHLFRSSMP